MIRHTVLLRWADTTSEEAMVAAMDALRGLSVLPGVQHLLVGTECVGRGTFDFGLACDFASRDDMHTYLNHPTHKAVMAEHIVPNTKPEKEFLDFEYPEA